MPVTHIIKVKQIAGAETHLLTLLGGLRARGLAVNAIMLHERDHPMPDFIAAAAERDVPVTPVLLHADFDPTAYAALRRALRMLKPHLGHTHLLHADLYGIPAARLAGINLIVTSRHNENSFRRRAPVRALNAGLWRMVSAGVAISESVAQFARSVEGADPAKLRVIPYGIPYTPVSSAEAAERRAAARAALNLPDAAPVVGMVGRLVEQKGFAYGLRACAALAERYPDLRVVVVGDGPLRATLQAEASALGDRASFAGWRADAADLMHGFDLLLMPSLWEGFGLVLLEAMAAALPVIASATSSVPEIIVEGETGLLAPPRDVAALTAALHALLNDRALRRHMGLLGQDRLEAHFTAARMVDQTAALYQELVERRLRDTGRVNNL